MKTPINTLVRFVLLSLIATLVCTSCSTEPTNTTPALSAIEQTVRQVHEDYVTGWLAMDETQVMGLLEDNAMIQPNRMTPITGIDNIREFWFPRDSSQTTINAFDTEIIGFHLQDSIAVMTHNSYLDWDYQKDTLAFGMIQRGINTTVYRQQADDSWKIWRSMWTDIEMTQKN